ncbi:cytochrome P450 [Glycomyces paridis]|uniref:Cytochrome P450 n=1 Tax=Glycomyces paridis TaxID=2126555 RepID=A0A4S8PD91_9ACTN|nr:cytochrome P450 [Glycomyces paridis]THV28343.1 cytochrome P450 [Glycomyces paridis]
MDVQADAPEALPRPTRWFNALRERAPVMWDAGADSWFVTRYDDVAALLTDRRLAAQPAAPQAPADPESPLGRWHAFVDRWPAFTDPPRHTALRRAMHPLFRPGHVEAAARATGEALRHGPTPGRLREAIGAGLTGLLADGSDFAELSAWAEAILAAMSGADVTERRLAEALAAHEALGAYAAAAVAARRGPLGAALADAREDGVLDGEDATAVYAQVLTGAVEPTLSVAVYAVERLGAEPGLWADFTGNRDGFVEELLRLAAPFHFAVRIAREAFVLRGKEIRAGDQVVLVLLSANRDPRRFPEPERLRADREGPPHVSFGRGRHACIGAPLARRAVAGLLEAAGIDALAGMRLDADGWDLTPGMRRWLV